MIQRMLWAVPGHAILLGVFFWWTGLSDAVSSRVYLGIAVAIVWLIAFGLLQRKLFSGAKAEALSSPRLWAAAGLFAASLPVAYLIASWIPNVQGLTWQLLSVGVRFGLAWLLINAAWCAVAWQSGLPPAEDSGLTVRGD